MTPTLIVCSFIAGRCFNLNITRVETYSECETQIVEVVTMKDDLVSRGILPHDVFIIQKECAS